MKHPPYASKSNLILKAASFARGDKLGALYQICEEQKTISTTRLEAILDDIADDLKLDATFLRKVADKMPDT